MLFVDLWFAQNIHQRGSAMLEQVVLLSLVSIAFATAVLTLGPALLRYHELVEFVLSLPVP